MAADWPQELAPGRKWHEKCLRFRSLEHVAYELNGRTIVAVFNFADKAVARATVAVRGKGEKRIAVGASRCRVFAFR